MPSHQRQRIRKLRPINVWSYNNLVRRNGSGQSGDATMPRYNLVGSIEAINSSAGTCSLRCFQILIGSMTLMP
jgi:hypothetical protein